MSLKKVFGMLPVSFAVILLFLIIPPAQATWSIIVANPETGELAIGSATCIAGQFNLKKQAGVMVVGIGAGQAQAAVDSDGENRTIMVNGLLNGVPLEEILEELIATDMHFKTRQYGMVDLTGRTLSYTGIKTGKFTGGSTGQYGPLLFAVQGNVLTGRGVVYAIEDALVQTSGDLGQKLMAAMHAAKTYGGDGRCSCSSYKPASCGCPPASFKKSAHVGYMTISRIGDTDGTFSQPTGFANGDYYMDLNIIKNSPPDPVDSLQILFDDFRASWSGHADHLLSEKTVHPSTIWADGQSQAELMIHLADIDDVLITQGGATITVTHDVESAGASTIGPVIDHGNGFYSVSLTAGSTAGTDLFRIVVDDGMGPVTLYPLPSLQVDAPALEADTEQMSALLGTPVEFSMIGGADRAGRIYLLLGSSSGTDPGFTFKGIQVPLNPDLFTLLLLYWTLNPVFPQGLGILDAQGDASAVLDPNPMELLLFVGKQLSFAWVTLMPLDFASNPVSVKVTP